MASPMDVTHSFTAGGTVLNALGSEPVPYLVALAMAAANQLIRTPLEGVALRRPGVASADGRRAS